MAGSSSSSPFYGILKEDQMKSQPMMPSVLQASSPAAPSAVPPSKKKRNLPGTPNPDAEVIALSPKTLMATNRFICEVCNKGFQREQNLQLHRRGHNLPWKLRQKSTKEVRRKVYLCPEPTCVHHDPSRALGDLTGIKKHFCRKHGEKKWKCDKCSKRYAVQSDWKAHSKTCGTREYRCDCGTLFSRRDSFITHRAFCDALAQESSRLPTSLTTIGTSLYMNNNNNNNMVFPLPQMNNNQTILNLHQDQNHLPTDILRLGGGSVGGTQLENLIGRQSQPNGSAFFLGGSNQVQGQFSDDTTQASHHQHPMLQNKAFHGLMPLPDLHAGTTNNSHNSSGGTGGSSIFNLGFYSNGGSTSSIIGCSNTSNNSNAGNTSNLFSSDHQFNNGDGTSEQSAIFAGGNMMGSGVSSVYNNSSIQNESFIPQMSATALLQKAAQMGATTSTTTTNCPSLVRGFAGSSSSSSSPKPGSLIRGQFSGIGDYHTNIRSQIDNQNQFQDLMNSFTTNGQNSGMFGINNSGGNDHNRTWFDGFSSNFGDNKLNQGINSMRSLGGSDGMTRDFLGVGGQIQQHQHHGLDIGAFDPEMKSNNKNTPFHGGNLQ